MSKKVVAMHFVCRNNMNVTELPDGTFESGVWKVDLKWRDTVKFVALHEGRDSLSYRQGEVIGTRIQEYNGKARLIFTIRPTHSHVVWHGAGAGEKGYQYE